MSARLSASLTTCADGWLLTVHRRLVGTDEMVSYLIRRLLAAVPVLLGVSVLVFSMLHLTPGDPVALMLSGGGGQGGGGASAEAIEKLRHELGFDRPIWEQYLRWLGNALRGDLGRAIWSNQRVTEMIVAQLGSTVQLAIAGLGLAIVFGVLLGVIAAVRAHTWIDSLVMAVASIGVSIPAF